MKWTANVVLPFPQPLSIPVGDAHCTRHVDIVRIAKRQTRRHALLYPETRQYPGGIRRLAPALAMRIVERQCRSARRMQPMALAADVETALIKMPYRAGDDPLFDRLHHRLHAFRRPPDTVLQRAWRKLQRNRYANKRRSRS